MVLVRQKKRLACEIVNEWNWVKKENKAKRKTNLRTRIYNTAYTELQNKERNRISKPHSSSSYTENVNRGHKTLTNLH